MKGYAHNAKWLLYFAPFRALSISAAYLTPFFLDQGLNLSEIFLLQSIFSAAYLLWEIPSGYIADRIGRARSIKLSVPLAAIAMTAYGFSSDYWQFVVCELILAFANGLISGADTALLYDSLKADGKEKEFIKLSQRIKAFGYGATALGVPLAIVLVHFISIRSTIIADGLLTAIGGIFAWKLTEAPRHKGKQEKQRLSAWHSVMRLITNVEARWLIALGTILSTATYIAFWLSTPYYQELGIPLILFSVILAIRSLWKAWLSHRFHQSKHIERNMISYALLAGLVYIAMATGQLWLVWIVLGHDVIQALHSQPIVDKLNDQHISHEHRATLNSVVNLVQRLAYTIVGPLVGLLIDKAGQRIGFSVIGVACSGLALLAIFRLRQLGTFRQKK